MTRRVWTLAEANAAVFRLEELLRRAQSQVIDFQEARVLLDGLQQEHGESVVMRDHPAHQQYADAMRAFHGTRHELGLTLRAFAELGVEVKDVQAGLVDFRAEMGGREVFLCWVSGEESVGHWHPLEGGFAGRQPIPDMETATN